MSARDIARVMTDSVVEFAAKSPHYLRQITICIFQSQMVQEFADAVAKKASNSSWRQTVKGISVVSSSLYLTVFHYAPCPEKRCHYIFASNFAKC